VAIRPVDLQQVVMKSPDVTRDTAAQQQAATTLQAQATEVTKRQAQQAETVQQFEEAGAVLIRDRQSRGGQQEQQLEDSAKEQADTAAGEKDTPKGAAPTRLGRHVDLNA
jgi:hypothetical protein